MINKSVFFFLISLIITFVGTENINAQQLYKSNKYLKEGRENKFIDFKKSISNYEKSIEYFSSQKDTFNLINSINELSFLYGHNLNFDKAYDGYWKALFLAEESADQFSKSKILQSLGWLYSFYNRNSKALENFEKALEINKDLVQKNETDTSHIISDYFSIANFYKNNGDFELAKTYLDSCSLYRKPLNNQDKAYFIEAEKGYLLAQEHKFDKAEQVLLESYNFFKANNDSYLVVIDFYLAKLYQIKNDIKKSKFHYQQSLKLSTTYKSHSDYQIKSHKELSEIYYTSKEYEKAFFHIKKAIDIENRVFGINSKNNKYLFEIKDKYRLQIEKQKQLIKEQKISELEHKQKMNFLRSILFFVTFLFLIIIGLLVFKNLRRKHKIEKQLLRQNQQLKLKENKKAIQLKNKELAKSALQLVEKDEFIIGLKNALIQNKETLNLNSINKIIKSIQPKVGSNWKEFEARFIDINQDFYIKIKEEFPNLTQSDLKICALIKLNFTSKDMSSLLGISIESVHTSRYRLRKKLNLERNDNLVEFISKY